MAESDPSSQHHEMAARSEEEEERLKYLEFVQTAAFRATECFFNVYGFAKDRSGPLKPGVETVEGTVKSVVGPLYNKFHDVPIEVLKFVDRKVDESVTKIDRHVPSTVKQASSQAMSAAQQAPEVARSVASEVRRSGLKDSISGIVKSVYAKYEPAAKQLYSKYEPKAEKCAALAWHKLNQLPVFPTVAQALLPTAAYCTEKYNETVQTTAKKGYKVSSYLPLVPTERIVKVFSKGRVEMEPLVN